MKIRAETADDHPAVHAVNTTADVPDDVFMALELEPGALAGKPGKMHYHQAFDDS